MTTYGPGFDSAHEPDYAQAAAVGYTFVCRYFAPRIPATLWKLLRTGELGRIYAHGLRFGPNWEWYESRPTEGYDAGFSDGRDFVLQMRAVGVPLGTVGWWSADQGGLTFGGTCDYARGMRDALHAAGYLVGFYGADYLAIALFNAGLIDGIPGTTLIALWQACATSWSQIYPNPRAAAVQHVGQNRLPDVDHDTRGNNPIGVTGPDGPDYGGDDMPSPKDWTADDWAAFRGQVWDLSQFPDPLSGGVLKSARNYIIESHSHVSADHTGPAGLFARDARIVLDHVNRHVGTDNDGNLTDEWLAPDLRNEMKAQAKSQADAATALAQYVHDCATAVVAQVVAQMPQGQVTDVDPVALGEQMAATFLAQIAENSVNLNIAPKVAQ